MKKQEPTPLIDAKKVARLTGLSPADISRLVKNRKIPFLVLGERLRFDPDEINKWIDAFRFPTVEDEPEPALIRRLLTVEEAAERLGISRRQVFYRIKEGTLLSVTIGRNRRIPAHEIDDYLARNNHHPADES